jgi:hypothetical protein
MINSAGDSTTARSTTARLASRPRFLTHILLNPGLDILLRLASSRPTLQAPPFAVSLTWTSGVISNSSGWMPAGQMLSETSLFGGGGKTRQ